MLELNNNRMEYTFMKVVGEDEKFDLVNNFVLNFGVLINDKKSPNHNDLRNYMEILLGTTLVIIGVSIFVFSLYLTFAFVVLFYDPGRISHISTFFIPIIIDFLSFMICKKCIITFANIFKKMSKKNNIIINVNDGTSLKSYKVNRNDFYSFLDANNIRLQNVI